MIHSIRQFLVISLLISITIASSITAVGNYVLDKQVIQPYLDEQLINFFSFIDALTQTHKISPHYHHKTQADVVASDTLTPATKSLVFQVLDKNNKLILHSKDSLKETLTQIPIGFSNQYLDGNNWRVYAAFDKQHHYKIIVAELYDIRKQLADDIAKNNAYILLVTYPIFGILIWIIVSLALRSIVRVTNEISNRASTYLEPVDAEDIAIEIKPLVLELNQLFTRLHLAFERNKRFSADAAHELRTPLAALKTQAQVALKADNDIERRKALLKMIQGVNRSSHIVTQLLTLSRLSQEGMLKDMTPVNLHKVATDVIADLAPSAVEKNIEIELEPSPRNPMMLGNETTLSILIRNIVDNAIRYTPVNGFVKIRVIDTQDKLILRVTDNGPGVQPELRERIFERFFRVLGTSAPGSGLGLAIVSQITELHHGQIDLNVPPNGVGLQFDVAFPSLPKK